MRDGVLLATDVVVADDGRPHPVLLVRTPYSRASLREGYDPVQLARSGWAVVLQDVRGRIDSEGEFRAFAQEVEDGYDTLEWCTQQEWCDGRVVMAGASYNGATQWLAAASGHPALKAIAPAVIGSDLRAHFCYQGDVLQEGLRAGWAIAIAGSGKDPELAADAVAAVVEWPEALHDPDRFSRLLPEYATWRDDDELWWKSTSVPVRELALPAWHLTGWYDVFCEGSLETYAEALAGGAPQRLVVGPWAHVNLYQQLVGDVDFGGAAQGLALGLPAQMQQFLRAALDGEDVPTGAAVFVMGENAWRELPAWPPTTTPLRWTFSEQGVLSACAWQHDPADPVPTHGGRTLLGPLPPAGPVDQRPVHQRDDVVVWTSEVLNEDLCVMGTLLLEVLLTSSSAQADLCATLCDVHPDGRVLNVVDGVLRDVGAPGEARALEVRVGSTAMVFRAGHRLALALSSSSWPRFDLSPAGSVAIDPTRTTLVLPVLEGS
jgi:putative CocE/NonD family hydrolase